MPRLRSCFILAITFLLLSSLALAQRDLGTLTGTVTDPSGAAVPNAKVTITEDATGLSYDVTTGANGEYTRPLLKPGTYTLTVEASGFRKAEQKNVVVTGGDRIGSDDMHRRTGQSFDVQRHRTKLIELVEEVQRIRVAHRATDMHAHSLPVDALRKPRATSQRTPPERHDPNGASNSGGRVAFRKDYANFHNRRRP